MRTLEWENSSEKLIMIDQRQLPNSLVYFECKSYQDVIYAIKEMVIRGAPAIGAAAAYGLVLAAIKNNNFQSSSFIDDVKRAGKELIDARPTAVNLSWAVNRMLEIFKKDQLAVDEYKKIFLAEAEKIAEEDILTNKKMAEIGAELIQDGDTIIHHCNTGSLATVDWGTALGVIRTAFEQGKKIHVLVDETRPRLQGARLTAWECKQYGIPFEIISDNMAGYFLQTGKANKVFFGADRVAANGDVANKIGSYMLALAAKDNHVPVYSVFPNTTIDLTIPEGKMIPIEERNTGEVLDISIHGQKVTPEGAGARNPSFDITPARLITAWITDKGIVNHPFETSINKLLEIQE